jgi:hypothetical protein
MCCIGRLSWRSNEEQAGRRVRTEVGFYMSVGGNIAPLRSFDYLPIVLCVW